VLLIIKTSAFCWNNNCINTSPVFGMQRMLRLCTQMNIGTLTAWIPRPAPANSFLFLLYHVTKSADNPRFKLWITPYIEQLALLLYIRGVPGLLPGWHKDYPDQDVSWYFSVLLECPPQIRSRLFNSSTPNRLIIPGYVIPATESMSMAKQNNSPAQGFALNFNSENCFWWLHIL
jgi:hypothetical protein